MPIDKELLELLVCPDSREKLRLAEEELVTNLNAAIEKGELRNRGGERVEQPLQSALLRIDEKIAYPVQEGIPNLLVDEGIPLDQLD